MATRSNIGYFENNTVTFVYCHHNGYPSHNGTTLLDSYYDIVKIKELISYGSIISFLNVIGEKNDGFDDYEHHVFCRFYHRDRGMHLEIFSLPANNINEALNNSLQQEYTYIFDVVSNQWFFHGYDINYQVLTKELCQK